MPDSKNLGLVVVLDPRALGLMTLRSNGHARLIKLRSGSYVVIQYALVTFKIKKDNSFMII